MPPLSVTLHSTDPGVGRIGLVGENDAYSANHLEHEASVLLDSGLHVVVDLTEATFIDSQTLSVLLRARHHAEVAQLGFVLVLPSETYTQVHRILDMTGLESAFAIEPNVERALAAARAGRTSGEHQRVA
jgi:anti-anti-sigma factor